MGVDTVGQVVALTGTQMDDPSGLAARLGLMSVRVTQKLLEHWKQRLTGHYRLLLNSSVNQTVTNDDSFPAIFLALDLKTALGFYWNIHTSHHWMVPQEKHFTEYW